MASAIKVRICIGTNCSFLGSQSIVDKLDSDDLFKGKISVETVKCFEKACVDGKNSPLVEIDGTLHEKMSIERVSEIIFAKVKAKKR